MVHWYKFTTFGVSKLSFSATIVTKSTNCFEMGRQGVFQLATLILILTTCVVGEMQEGYYLRDQILNPIKVKLENIVSACSPKVHFNIPEINPLIRSCGELFNTLGEVKVDFPGYKFPQSDDEAEQAAFRESIKLDNDLRAKQFCTQLSSTVQCLQSIKSIVEQCQSPEGIVLFSIAEELCHNDGKIINDLVESLKSCARFNRQFGEAVETCEREAGGLEKYYEPNIDAEKIANELCNIVSVLLDCAKKGLTAAGPSQCSQFRDVAQSFVIGFKSRASNSQALKQCIR